MRDLGQYVGWLARTNGRTDTLVSKVSVTQLAILVEAGILDQLLERTSFILLERDDKLGQAISYALALGTNRWTSAHELRLAPQAVPYAANVITGFIRGVATEMSLFYQFFGLNGIVPMHVSYEQLVATPETVIARIGEWLNLPDVRFVRSALRLERQAGAVNETWRKRFLAGD